MLRRETANCRSCQSPQAPNGRPSAFGTKQTNSMSTVHVATDPYRTPRVAPASGRKPSLIMDSVHNFSDELALAFLYLAFILSQGLSRNLLRSANIFNSVGLIAVSALLLMASCRASVSSSASSRTDDPCGHSRCCRQLGGLRAGAVSAGSTSATLG
jgi:hypothetical protein